MSELLLPLNHGFAQLLNIESERGEVLTGLLTLPAAVATGKPRGPTPIRHSRLPRSPAAYGQYAAACLDLRPQRSGSSLPTVGRWVPSHTSARSPPARYPVRSHVSCRRSLPVTSRDSALTRPLPSSCGQICAMSRSGLLPRPLSIVQKETGTPYVAFLFGSVSGLAVCFVSWNKPDVVGTCGSLTPPMLALATSNSRADYSGGAKPHFSRPFSAGGSVVHLRPVLCLSGPPALVFSICITSGFVTYICQLSAFIVLRLHFDGLDRK